MTIATLLEDFASSSVELPNEPQRPEDLIGYSLGYDAGIAEAANQEAQAIKELTNAIEELGFGYNEAMRELSATLHPLFKTLIERVVPECLDASLQLLIIEAIETAAQKDLRNPITVFANPVHVAPLESVAASIASIPLTIVADAALQTSEVRFEASSQETSFDSALLRSELVNALAAFLDTSATKGVENG